MKAIPIALLFSALLLADEDEKRVDPTKLLADLMKANAEKDVTAIDALLKDVIEIGQTSKSKEEVDPLAKELVTSLKLAKGNSGTEKKILEAMGELRSKKALGVLKKWAFRKKSKTEHEEAMQIEAVGAIAKMRDARLVDKLGDVTKSRSVLIAKAAYASFKHYGPAKGKVRKKVAEILMKRLEAEKPVAGQSGKVSAEQQERWQKLERVMVESMQAVCHQDTINDIENWREWWKENKKNAKAWKDEKKKE